MLRGVLLLTLLTLTATACLPSDAPPSTPAGHAPRGRDTHGVMTLDQTTLLPLALSIPKSLIAAGVTQVGALDLIQLVARLQEISWYFFEIGFPAGSEGTRTTGIYYADSKEVFVGRVPWNQLEPAFRPALVLHEGLGASGYDDVHYGLSATLSYLASIQGDPDKLKDVLATPAILEFFGAPPSEGPATPILLAEGGSGTGVGGGGDEIGVRAKLTLLTLAHEASRRGLLGDEADANAAYDRLLRLILRISIEGDRDRRTWISTEDKNPFTIERNVSGRERVGIPVFVWRQHEDAHDHESLKQNVLIPLFKCLAAEAGVPLKRAPQ